MSVKNFMDSEFLNTRSAAQVIKRERERERERENARRERERELLVVLLGREREDEREETVCGCVHSVFYIRFYFGAGYFK